jgi:DNA repair protein RecO (recombination protein O)
MATHRVSHEPAYVLHHYDWSESSLILEVFTRHHGRIALVAKGAKRPSSNFRPVLLPLQPLQVSYGGDAEIRTLKGAEWMGGHVMPTGEALLSGYYLNELLLRLLARDDAHEALFDAYAGALAGLAGGGDVSPVLRAFEKRLLAELGYAPLLEREAASGEHIDPDRSYGYEPDRGPVPAANGGVHLSGRTLLDMAADDYSRQQTRDEARLLMRTLIAQRLHGQVLHTRAVLMELNEL